MTDEATLRKRLADAEEALHQLSVGQSAVMLGHKGKNVTFRKTDAAQLRAYIRELKGQLGIGGREPPLTMRWR